MNCTDQSGNREIRQALKDLRSRAAASLRAFNEAVPYAVWLRRSEIESMTADLLRAVEQAPQRRHSTPHGMIDKAPVLDHTAKNGGTSTVKLPDLSRQLEDKV